MTPQIASAYAQLLSVGLLVIGFHCVGMCGPILCGLQIGHNRFELLFYQLGRTVVYMTLGALVGFVGAVFKQYFSYAGAALSILVGVLVILQARHLMNFKVPKMASKLAILQPGEMGLMRPMFLGVALGFMPCMITLWALGIAATTASVFHGALIMALLVLMTTPALWVATRLPKIMPRFGRMAPWFLMASGVWMIVVGLAGVGLIEHQHLVFSLGTHEYMIMFW